MSRLQALTEHADRQTQELHGLREKIVEKESSLVEVRSFRQADLFFLTVLDQAPSFILASYGGAYDCSTQIGMAEVLFSIASHVSIRSKILRLRVENTRYYPKDALLR